MKRLHYNIDFSKDYEPEDQRELAAEPDANAASSRLEDGRHAPALDLDVPARLVPSSTPGHSHLYIDVPMSWAQYERILVALGDAGVLEENYVKLALQRKATYLRKPGVLKVIEGGKP